MTARVRAWVRRVWSLVTDPSGAAESDVLVASLKASAVKAALRPGAADPTVRAVTTVEVAGVVLVVVVAGGLCLAGQDVRGWLP